MISEGTSGNVPYEYHLIQAAKYLGVAPWDLAERETGWFEFALIARSAEAEAEKLRAEEQQRGF